MTKVAFWWPRTENLLRYPLPIVLYSDRRRDDAMAKKKLGKREREKRKADAAAAAEEELEAVEEKSTVRVSLVPYVHSDTRYVYESRSCPRKTTCSRHSDRHSQ